MQGPDHVMRAGPIKLAGARDEFLVEITRGKSNSRSVSHPCEINGAIISSFLSPTLPNGLHAFYIIRNLPQGLVPKVPYS